MRWSVDSACPQTRLCGHLPLRAVTSAPHDHLNAARQRVTAGLLFSHIARSNELQIDGERVRSAIESIAQTFEQPAQVVELYYNNQNLLSGVENSVLEEQVVDWVLTQADVSDKKMNFQEVIQAASSGR